MESEYSNQGGSPPALPVKHHWQRSHSQRSSSIGSNCAPLSPGLQPPNYTLNDVFESTDCHATSCPIHHDVDSVKHQMRFLSDGTPPPVPRKRLVRTLSLPAEHVPPLSPLSPWPPHQTHPQNFDNPLYMLTPVPDPYLNSKAPSGLGGANRSTAPLLPLSRLSFDTSDEHLANFFLNFEDQNVVSQTVQHRHLLFLKDMAQNMMGNVLLKEELSEKTVPSYQPQDFLLDEGTEPKTGRIYYSVHSPKFPGRTLGLRIYLQTNMPASTCTQPQHAHVNLKHIVAHFQPTGKAMDSCTKAQLENSSSIRGCTSTTSPCGVSNEYANYSGSSLLSTVQHLLWKGYGVHIERDLPSATLEDFVQEGQSMQNMDCVLYDKRVCFLLLQILQGTQHLYKNNACAPRLVPQEILLVWPDTKKAKPELSHVKISKKVGINNVSELVQEGYIQMLWESQGCPRVVFSSQTSGRPVSQSFVSIKSNIEALIQYCLNVHKGLSALYMSTYRKALLYVKSQLKDNSSGFHLDNMASVLQVVLWGPGDPFVNHIEKSTAHSWLVVKRALLVMKLAEKGVDQTALDWEDILCLQYVAFTEVETVVNASQLGSI